jgi:hypothetical protein
MPDTNSIPFSHLPNVPALSGTDIFALSAVDDTQTPASYVSYKTTMNAMAVRVVADTDFINLKTASKRVEGAINETISNLANDYDNTSTYEAGDCVLYGGGLYKCIVAIPTAEEWDSTHWQAIKAVDVGSGGSTPWVDVTGTLVAGQTSITLSNATITTNSTIDYYTNVFGVNPTNVSVVTGAVTLTFDSQASDLGVKVRIT